MNTVNTKLAYHFRSFAVAAPTAKQADELAANPTAFEAVDATVGGAVVKSWKRKSQEVELAIPTLTSNDTLQGKELQLVNDLLAQLVQDFAKSQYVDKFLPVGNHSLADVIAHREEMAARKPSSNAMPVPSPEALAIGASVLSQYFEAIAPKVAPRVASSELFKKACSDTAIKAFVVAIDYDRLTKLIGHAEACLELVPSLELGQDEPAAAAALAYLANKVTSLRTRGYGKPLDEDDGM